MVGSTPRPYFTSGKDPVPIVQEDGWAQGPVWTGGENIAATGIRFPGPFSPYPVAIPTRLPGPQKETEGKQQLSVLESVEWPALRAGRVIQRNEPPTLLNNSLGGPQKLSRCSGKPENYSPPGINSNASISRRRCTLNHAAAVI